MKAKTIALVIGSLFCLFFSSCKLDVFAHDYSTASVRAEYVDNDPMPPGVSEDDEDGDADYSDADQSQDIWAYSAYKGWSEMLKMIF